MDKFEALQVLQSLHPSVKVADEYDDNDELRDALNSLIPDFEYPDFSHLTIGEIIKKL